MLSRSPSIRIFVHTEPTDMRNYAVTVFMRSSRGSARIDCSWEAEIATD